MVRGSGGEALRKLKHLAFVRSMEDTNLILGNAKVTDFCCLAKMQGCGLG